MKNAVEKELHTFRFPQWAKLTMIIFTIVRLWLTASQTVAVSYSGADDFLFIKLANNIIEGNWLGTYNNLTLAKGPFYPIYIAATFFLGIPLLTFNNILYITSCLLLIISIRPLIKNPVTLSLLYILLLFNPMSFNTYIMTRLKRETIYYSLTLLTIGCCIGLYLCYNRSFRIILLWSIGFGLSLSAFWLTREEGVWLVPSVSIIMAFAMFKIWREKPDDWRKRLALCLLPFLIWLALLGTVASINKAYYGVFRITDFKSRSFLSALNALMRVKPEKWRPMLHVPAETRERIYKVSPSFAKLKIFLEGDFTKGARRDSCKILGICDDIGGGWFMWAFRQAVQAAGFYNSAIDADNYYNKVSIEVDTACKEKKLNCHKKKFTIFGQSIIPPLNSYYIKPFIKSFAQGFYNLLTLKSFQSQPLRSVALLEHLTLFSDISGEQLTPTATTSSIVVLRGWAFHPKYPIELSIRTQDGDIAPAWIKTKESPDVYKYFTDRGMVYESAKRARFELRTSCNECFLYVSRLGKIIERVPLKSIIKSKRINSSRFFSHLDYVYTRAQLQDRLWLARSKAHFLKKIAIFYQYTVPFLIIPALLIQLFGTIQVFKKGRIPSLYIINTALLIAIIARLSILAIIDITLFPAVNRADYLSPLHPMIIMIIVFNLLCYKHFISRQSQDKVG